MIPGIVSSSLEAIVRLHILDGNGQSQAIDAVIDTGFQGFLNLPVALVTSLALPWIYQDVTRLIDGRIVLINIHSATVIWNGKPRIIDVQALGNYTLIGMRLLAAHDLHIRVADGGAVSIDLIP